MNKQTILVVIIALLIGGAGGYTIANKKHTTEKFPSGMHVMEDGTMMDDKNVDMMQMDHSGMMVESERAFIEGMIPHHQEAVDTANEVIARGGTTPEIKSLVENIVIAQETEIADMKQWYQDWYNEAYVDNGTYVPMMRELGNLSGAELDRVFLEDMIGHHMGAIMMAQSVQPYIKHEEISELTKAIATTQSAEITEMKRILETL